MKKNPIQEIYGRPATEAYVNPRNNDGKVSRAVDSYDSVQHSLGYVSSFDNILPGQSGRTEYTRQDYEYFRPSESLPKKYKEIVKSIDLVYSSLSIVRNIIDLMSDFGSEGIQITHPSPSIEKFYKDWFTKVQGVDRSERFLSGLYRHGMVVAQQLNADVKSRKLAREVLANDIKLTTTKIKPNNIPVKYIFHNPGNFHHENYHKPNESPIYKIEKPASITDSVFHNIGNSYSNGKSDDLDPNKTSVFYYKKDDWQSKPIPFLYPIIKHAIMIEKLNLADSSALDGAISKVRIFRIGDIDKELWPSENTMEKLDQILRSNSSGGTIDIIWGPDIDIVESDTDIHNFLGQEKYVPHLSQVYEGLGIPASFVGAGQGTTNNYISLKILTRRLMSGRERLIEFWNEQIKQVQKAMGFSEPAKLEFNHLDLGDEESERQLLIQLLDRNIISAERVQKILGFDPRLENRRLIKEDKQREKGKMPQKASQFHQPEKEFIFERTALEKGYFAPEHLNINKEPGTEHILSPQQLTIESIERGRSDKLIDSEVKKGAGGRPKGSKDVTQRKSPEFKPKTKAALEVWVSNAQNKISEIIKPALLNALGKKNMREVTAEEMNYIEKIKFVVLLNTQPFTKINSDVVLSSLDSKMSKDIEKEYISLFEEIQETFGSVSIEDTRSIQKTIYIGRNYEHSNEF